MKILNSCQQAIHDCLTSQTFAVAHLYNDEKPMNMHIHDSYEIYFSISGGKQFLIDNRFYSIQPGDLFFINQYETHHLTQIDSQIHERIIFSIYPDFLKSLSSEQTDLNHCFCSRPLSIGHKLSLSEAEQRQLRYFVHRLSSVEGFGSDILNKSIFAEFMIFLNTIFINRENTRASITKKEFSELHHTQTDRIISYINQNIRTSLTIDELSEYFSLSPSYLCRSFKSATGTTINKYITAKRITLAKSLLREGKSVNEACVLCGFNDYSNFLKSFTKAVGVSPKKYIQLSI